MTTPRLLSNRYELGALLGYGGMSEVHRAVDVRLGRDVAVKVLRADLDRDRQFRLGFRREAQNALVLNHPAIVAVYDTGEVQSEFGPLPYMVMEYVDGHTLREIVKTQGPMSQQRVIEVMADVCAALDYGRKRNIIHRDVRPANIMINRAGAVKVMDFGIARVLGEGQNVAQTAAVIGTAQYLSPEQARGQAVDARSDVYAAGCVLFELLTGEPPFTGDTPVAVAYQHVREDPRFPSEVNAQVTPALDAIVLTALRKSPADRYQYAGQMRADLERARSGTPPIADVAAPEQPRRAPPATQQAARQQPPVSTRPAGERARRPGLLERLFGDVRRQPLAEPLGAVFISYRRQDEAGVAGRLYDRLVGQFGREGVFMDVDSIELGLDFVEVIDRSLARCSAVVVVIGRNWLRATDEHGRLRLENPTDYVRLEIETALRRGIRVIPVVVDGASMPDGAELPQSMASLARRNGLPVSHARFDADASRLVDALRRFLAQR